MQAKGKTGPAIELAGERSPERSPQHMTTFCCICDKRLQQGLTSIPRERESGACSEILQRYNETLCEPPFCPPRPRPRLGGSPRGRVGS